MTATLLERAIADRFDAVAGRFKADVADDDYRLVAVRAALAGLVDPTVLDLGCGKGRFARRFPGRVIGVDASRAMLAEGVGLARVLASARRLPLADASVDAAVAIEVFEHLPDVDAALAEVRRVVRPGGVVAIVDKNLMALDAARPWLPKGLVKRIDTHRGRWMYRAGEPIAERWFRPSAFANRLRGRFDRVEVRHPIAPDEARRWVFRAVPRARLMTLWTARVPGGPA